MRLWCEHIQPDQVTKTRYFGGWCSRKRTQYHASCHRLLGLGEAVDEVAEDVQPESSATLVVCDSQDSGSSFQCSACESHSLCLIVQTPKPTWSSVLTHLDDRCPAWYAETDYAEHCEYLKREYGISYEDWDLETRIESTMSRRLPTAARQLYLPGLSPESAYLIESY